MASSIDPSVPIAGHATTLSVRNNFLAAKNEIEALQGSASVINARRGATIISVASAPASGGVVTMNVTDWFNEGQVLYLKLTAIGNTLLTTFELYGRDTYQVADRMYQAAGADAYTAPYEDRIPFWYRDIDATTELHLRVINNGGNASTYTLEIVGMGI